MDYARAADCHWATYLPAARASLDDPDGFFQELGERVHTQICRLAAEILANEASEPDEVERGWQVDRARRKAEEIFLADEVFLRPEPGSENNELP